MCQTRKICFREAAVAHVRTLKTNVDINAKLSEPSRQHYGRTMLFAFPPCCQDIAGAEPAV
eukprot:1157504-Amphidinium_carterae.1